ncbi:hypothetical protein ACFV2H_22040 [Streptomyces sp. NPDC059629]|uniref:hypothetical protein n=1 Tax=Streptomyces sp. NPDC059629 TaxID=3346889 RepID=UPI003693ACB4
MRRFISRILAIAILAAASVVAFTGSASASTPSGCSDVRQFGPTAYVTVGGQTAASLKQYYSPACHEAFGYLWVWDSFRASHSGWNVKLRECGPVGASNPWCNTPATWSNVSSQEFWSNPNYVNYCPASNMDAFVEFAYNQYDEIQTTDLAQAC